MRTRISRTASSTSRCARNAPGCALFAGDSPRANVLLAQASRGPQLVRVVDLDETAKSLARRVDQLESGPATLTDWMGAEAALGGALLAGQHLLATYQRTMATEVRSDRTYSWARTHTSVAAIAAALEQLRLLRLRAQSRIFEHQVTAQQSPYMRFS